MSRHIAGEPSAPSILQSHIPLAPAARRAVGARPLALLGGIVGLAALLRLAGLSAIALWGDEYGSISEATTRFGSNLTSLLYSAVLHVFLLFGNDAYIARLPAAIFGIAAVAAIYVLGSALVDRRTGLVAALLAATSSYAIGYSQEVRFYSLFLCTGALALHALSLVARDGPTPRRIAWLVVANLLCLASQPLGILVVGSEVVSLLFLTAPAGRAARRLVGLVVIVAAGAAILSSHQVRIWGFHLLAHYTAAHVPYTGPRGLHLTDIVKIGWTYYVFAFGERVYPLWLWLTIPGAILIGVLCAHGLWSQRTNRFVLGILLPQLVINPALLYLVFDAVTPATLQGASPRYLIPLLNPFLILIAIGITTWRIRWAAVLSLILILGFNGLTLTSYWRNTWNYNGYSPDWSRVASLVARYARPDMLVLADGRSVDPIHYYLGDIEQSHHLKQADLTMPVPTADLSPRIVVIANTDRTATQEAINIVLDRLQQRYAVVDGFVRYPLFAYVLERKQSWAALATPATTNWRFLPIPVNIYGLDLADISLPATLRSPQGGPAMTTHGAWSLSSVNGSNTRTITSPTSMTGSTLLLATTLENDAALPAGSPVATLTLSGASSKRVQTIVLRKGSQVDDWQRAGRGSSPKGAEYRTGYRWMKLASLVGQRSYPEAYKQFTAGIAVAALPLSGQRFNRITLRYVAPSGILHVWSAAVR